MFSKEKRRYGEEVGFEDAYDGLSDWMQKADCCAGGEISHLDG